MDLGGLIIGYFRLARSDQRSLPDVTSTWEGKVWQMVWTMVALRSNQRAKSHYSLIIGRTKVWTMVALRFDQRPKSGHKLHQKLTTEL